MVIAWVDLMLPMLLHHSPKGAGMPDILIQTGRCPGKGHTEHARNIRCKSGVFPLLSKRSSCGVLQHPETRRTLVAAHLSGPEGRALHAAIIIPAHLLGVRLPGRMRPNRHMEHAIQTDRLQWCKSIVFHHLPAGATKKS